MLLTICFSKFQYEPLCDSYTKYWYTYQDPHLKWKAIVFIIKENIFFLSVFTSTLKGFTIAMSLLDSLGGGMRAVT